MNLNKEKILFIVFFIVLVIGIGLWTYDYYVGPLMMGVGAFYSGYFCAILAIQEEKEKKKEKENEFDMLDDKNDE